MIICFAFRSTLVRIMQAPLQEVGSQVGTLKALGITDSIVISFHLAFYAGIVLSFPLLLYFVAEFVLPALTAVEKRFLFPAIFVSFALFLLGVLVCYFWLLPKTILFFFRDTESLGWAPTWTVQQYYSFVTRFTIGFGLAFELPVVVLPWSVSDWSPTNSWRAPGLTPSCSSLSSPPSSRRRPMS